MKKRENKEKKDYLAECCALNKFSMFMSCNPVGSKFGMCVYLERKLGRRLHTVGCHLHLNELPLRHLIEELDGGTQSPNGFSGNNASNDYFYVNSPKM